MQILSIPKLGPQDAPASPDEGTSYYDSVAKVWKYWNGTEWVVTS